MTPGFSGIVFLIIVAFSTISWIYRKLQEQKQRKMARDNIVRQQEELLRTGRVEATAEPAAPAMGPVSGGTLAERQAKLRELRRRAQAQAQTQSAATSGQVTASPTGQQPPRGQGNVPPGMREVELWPGGPRILVPIPTTTSTSGGGMPSGAARRTAAPATMSGPSTAPARQTQRPKRQRPAQPNNAASTTGATPSIREQVIAAQAEERAAASRQRAIEEARPRAPVGSDLAKQTRQPFAHAMGLAPGSWPTTPLQWRQAIILNEVLGRPVSERDGHLG